MRLISNFISVLFHPMLMPTIGIFLIFQAGTHVSYISFEAKRIIYITVFLSTCILPLSILPLLYQFKAIQSFNMENARERILPVFLTGFFYYMGYMLLKKMGVPTILGNFMLASLLAVFSAVAVTMFWKISMHMIGIGGITGAILALALRFNLDLSIIIVLLLIFSGLTGTARLHLGAHSPAQIYIGYLGGLLIVFSSIFM
jgi:hypothetical protein